MSLLQYNQGCGAGAKALLTGRSRIYGSCSGSGSGFVAGTTGIRNSVVEPVLFRPEPAPAPKFFPPEPASASAPRRKLVVLQYLHDNILVSVNIFYSEQHKIVPNGIYLLNKCYRILI